MSFPYLYIDFLMAAPRGSTMYVRVMNSVSPLWLSALCLWARASLWLLEDLPSWSSSWSSCVSSRLSSWEASHTSFHACTSRSDTILMSLNHRSLRKIYWNMQQRKHKTTKHREWTKYTVRSHFSVPTLSFLQLFCTSMYSTHSVLPHKFALTFTNL